MFAKLLRRLRYWRDADTRSAALSEEMQFHIDNLADEYEAEGMTREAALARARQQFGNRTALSETSRETWLAASFDQTLRDLRHGARSLVATPGFTLFAIAILGLGAGACATVFGVLDALVLRPLPVARPAELAFIANGEAEGLSGETIQVGHLQDMARRTAHFAAITGYMAFYGVEQTRFGAGGRRERITVVPVAENFFPTLGVTPQFGRQFQASEALWGAPKVLLLSHRFWTTHFAADPAIIGREVDLDDARARIIGVMPAEFDFGALFAPGVRIDAFSPFPLAPQTDRWGNTMSLLGRLRPGSTVVAAQVELSAMAKELQRLPRRNALIPRVSSLHDRIRGNTRQSVWLVFAAVVAVLLIVCANLASLQLARASSRRKEFAIRTALGAGQLRLWRQLWIESLLLASGGCAIALAFAALCTRLIANLDTLRVPLLSLVRLDRNVALFTLAICLLAALLFSILSAVSLARTPIEALKSSSRGASSSTRMVWTRKLLVVGEVSFACVLLLGAVLLLRGMMALLAIDPGFVSTHAWSVRVDIENRNPARLADALARVRALAGVTAAALTDSMPFGRNRTWGIAPWDRKSDPLAYNGAYVRIVSDDFVTAMGLRLIEGREFTRADGPGSDRVTMINEALARRIFPGQSAIGKLMRIDGDKPRRIIGVLHDTRHLAVDQPAGFEFYLPATQTDDSMGFELVVRSTIDRNTLAAQVKATLQPFDPVIGATAVVPVQDLLDRSLSPRRALAICLAGFAAFALVLASLGIYALIAYTVAQRRKELGIRLALGASPGGLQWSVVRESLGLILLGICGGALLAIPLLRAVQGLVFNVTPGDPLNFILMAGCFLLTGIAASYLPARGVTRIAPVETIRDDA